MSGCVSLPVTNAEEERSFSQLRRLKTFLRATMGEERLVGISFDAVPQAAGDSARPGPAGPLVLQGVSGGA